MNLLSTDINNCVAALEYFIIMEEEVLISENAGDEQWQELETYRATLNNLNYLKGIYGK